MKSKHKTHGSNERLTIAFTEVSEEKEKLKVENGKLNKIIDELREQKVELQDKNAKLQKEVEQLREDAGYINGTMGDMLGEYKELNNKLQLEFDQLKESAEEKDTIIINLKEQGQRQVEELKEEVAHKEALVAEFEVEQHNERKRYAKINGAADEMESAINTSIHTLNQLNTNGLVDNTIYLNRKALENYKQLTQKQNG